jgi:hypothetical protein
MSMRSRNEQASDRCCRSALPDDLSARLRSLSASGHVTTRPRRWVRLTCGCSGLVQIVPQHGGPSPPGFAPDASSGDRRVQLDTPPRGAIRSWLVAAIEGDWAGDASGSRRGPPCDGIGRLTPLVPSICIEQFVPTARASGLTVTTRAARRPGVGYD